ncbi:lipoxygenase family protein [Nostoc sp. MS1]|uniref:lipoxygenase family protein n=1 Tax=Nostoc sp. MS1 TaxID=2764711 RepID=UPI001CC81978|nr:lipoxygenase family protein [Nostoc sp. MS1]BCL38283.1 arachidonate 15-lipoxygenase [Nostoc sp. MS1]
MNNSLPNDPVNLSIADNLAVARQQYQYNYTHIPSIAMVDELPATEQFSTNWLFLLAQQLRVLFINTLITNRGNRGSQSVRDDVKRFILEAIIKGAIPFRLSVIAKLLQIIPQFLIKSLSKDFREIDDLLFSLLRECGLSIFEDSLDRVLNLLYKDQPTGHVTNLQDYEKLLPEIPLPAIASTYQQDEVFAYMQVAGFNPVMIERIETLGDGVLSTVGDRFPVTDEHFQAVMGSDDSLSAAGQQGRLYLADYGILEGAINGTYPHEQKYLYAPLALFALPQGSESNRLLRPIAIQCGQTPGPDYPIITPQSGKYSWLFAKTVVQIADANFHEAVTHLGRTHLFVGPFVMATYRQLPTNHPLRILLHPHFEGTLAINDAAQRILIAPGGGVDRLLSSTIDNARVLAVRGLQSYSFNNAMLPKQLKQRGVDDPNLLPVYPYRDDGLLIWNAIHQWVSDYLKLYYPTDQNIQKDTALQTWAAEAQAYDGGRVPDFGENGGIQTRDYLADAVTLIIFTASAQHGAVNFPQKDLMGYAPVLPLAGYLPASTLKTEVTEQDYLNLLPPLDQAQRQLNLLSLLGSVYYNKLGDYQKEYFTNPKVKPLLQAFQTNLQQIEDTINQRNLHRPSYEYLLPSRIPQSINI